MHGGVKPNFKGISRLEIWRAVRNITWPNRKQTTSKSQTGQRTKLTFDVVLPRLVGQIWKRKQPELDTGRAFNSRWHFLLLYERDTALPKLRYEILFVWCFAKSFAYVPVKNNDALKGDLCFLCLCLSDVSPILTLMPEVGSFSRT